MYRRSGLWISGVGHDLISEPRAQESNGEVSGTKRVAFVTVNGRKDASQVLLLTIESLDG
eukprot:7848228-Lingulodinium_polyedra.AAC.1